MYEDENYIRYKSLLGIMAIRMAHNPYKETSEEENKVANKYKEQVEKLEVIRQRTFLAMLGENTVENNLFTKVTNILNSKDNIEENNINKIFSEIDNVISDYDYKKTYEKKLVDKEELEK